MNVGSIFRLADAGRIERLYLCGITGYPPVPADPRPPWVAERAGRAIAKTAIHTVPFVPWEYRPDPMAVLEELKAQGVQLVALERTDRSVSYVRSEYQLPVCLIVGHEREGVPTAAIELADKVVDIPMWGAGRSLNVSTALGICLYEILRRYVA